MSDLMAIARLKCRCPFNSTESTQQLVVSFVDKITSSTPITWKEKRFDYLQQEMCLNHGYPGIFDRRISWIIKLCWFGMYLVRATYQTDYDNYRINVQS